MPSSHQRHNTHPPTHTHQGQQQHPRCAWYFDRVLIYESTPVQSRPASSVRLARFATEQHSALNGAAWLSLTQTNNITLTARVAKCTMLHRPRRRMLHFAARASQTYQFCSARALAKCAILHRAHRRMPNFVACALPNASFCTARDCNMLQFAARAPPNAPFCNARTAE